MEGGASAQGQHAAGSAPIRRIRSATGQTQDLATTKLVGGARTINQEVFTRTITRAGAAQQEVAALFDFYRPIKRPSAMASTILRLTDKQHDVLYALSGCSDVSCTMSKVDKKTRKALVQVYGIDKQQFSTWFKNRRPKPRKEASSMRRDFTGIRGSPTATDGLLQHAPSLSDRADGSGERAAVHGDAGSPDDDGGYDAAVQKQYADMQQQYVAAQAAAAEGQYTSSPVSCTGSLTGGGNGNGAAAVSLYSSPVKADPAHGPASPATHIAAAGSVSHMCVSDGAALGGGCTPPMEGRRISGSHEIKRRTSVCSRLEPPSKLVCSLSRTLSRTLSAGDSDNAVRLTHRHSGNNNGTAAAHVGAGYPLDETMRNGGGGGRCYDAQLHPDPPMLQSSHQPVLASQQALYQSHTSVRTPAHTSAHTSAG